MSFRQRVGKLFSSPWLALANTLLCLAAILANAYFQYFCRPVPWAMGVLVAAFVPLITYNLYRDPPGMGKGAVFFLFGIAACICVYCILFIGLMNGVLILAFPVFMGRPVALLAYLLHFLLAQVIFHLTTTAEKRKWRKYFAAGAGLCLLSAVYVSVLFSRNKAAVEAAISDPGRNAAKLVPGYITERMLGMHFKYHTELCLYDGWRPPLHDPLLVTASWLNYPFLHAGPPLDIKQHMTWHGQGWPFMDTGSRDLRGRVAAYRIAFPDKPVRADCPCAKAYGNQYLNSPLFK